METQDRNFPNGNGNGIIDNNTNNLLRLKSTSIKNSSKQQNIELSKLKNSQSSGNDRKFIDFRKFCDIMKYFTINYSFDLKCECK